MTPSISAGQPDTHCVDPGTIHEAITGGVGQAEKVWTELGGDVFPK